MRREGVQHRNPLWLKLVAAGLAGLVVVAAIIVLAPQLLQNPSSDVVVIKADATPFKERPKDAGGMEIPHQDTTVMGMLSNVLPQNETPERLRPPEVAPEMPPTPVIDENSTEVAVEPKPVDGGDTAQIAAGTNSGAADAEVASETSTSNTAEIELATVDDTADQKDTRDAVERGDTAAARPTPKPDAAVRPKTVSPDGDPFYLVQLAAFRDAGKAREQAGLMTQKHAGRLNGTTLGTMKVDTGENVIFWRVVSEPLPRADADTLCANLKRAGQDCILRKFNLLSE